MRQKTVWQDVHGIVLLDKGLGYSSNQALQQVRRLYRAAKAGHTGTLDPLATGLLPLCLGEASKFAQGLLDADKTYTARLCLGITTSTGDAEGQELSRHFVEIDPGALEQVVEKLTGVIEQIPPMYSALKHQGKPLYEFARLGIDIVREARAVTVKRLKVVGTSFDGAVSCEAGQAWIDIEAHVSKGTYIRTLVQDMGALLGCGAHVSDLRRTQLGQWQVSQASSFETLQLLSPMDLMAQLLPVDAMLGSLMQVELTVAQQTLFSNGGRVRVYPLEETVAQTYESNVDLEDKQHVRVYAQEQFLGVAHLIQGVLHPVRLIQRVES